MSPGAAEPIALVDSRNVVRSRWPNIRAGRFLALARAWAEREGVGAILVFDGAAPGGRVGAHELDERTTLVGTGAGSADDWIADEVRRLAGEGRAVWAVSSDRELRERVAPFVVRTIGGGSFVTLLERVEEDADTRTSSSRPR